VVRAITAAGLLVALLGPPLFVIIPRWLAPEPRSLSTDVIIQVLYCGLVPLILWIVVHGERLPLRSIGLRRPDRHTLVTALLLWVAVLVVSVATQPLVDAAGREGVDRGVRELLALPAWFRVVMGATGGVVEETLYRGYAIERLGTIVGRRWGGGAIAALVFGVVHAASWGWGFALTADLPFGIVMTAFYLWRRDLIANIAVHSTGLIASMATLLA
jgi:membrane protease YdiL (CAAX protease family)